MTLKRFFGIFKTAAVGWFGHNVPSLAAAIAFYAIFSLAPLLIIVITIAGFIWGAQAARGEVFAQLADYVGQQAAEVIRSALRNLHNSRHGGLAMIVGLVTLVIAATGVMVELQAAMNVIWGVGPSRRGAVWDFLRQRLLSLALVGAAGLVLILSLLFSAILSAAQGFLGNLVPGLNVAFWQYVNQGVSLVLVMAVFAAIYKFLPETRVPWPSVFPGALVAGVLFTVGKYFIGLYLGRSTTTSAYGAAGAMLAVLLWIYYSTMIFFYGAEVTRAWAAARK